jgi:heat shock protein HslJ
VIHAKMEIVSPEEAEPEKDTPMTRPATLALTCAMLIGGCNGTVSADTAPPTGPQPVRTLSDIRGEWDVLSFEGQRPNRLNGSVRAAFADFGDNGVSLRMECNYTGAQGSVKDGRFVAKPDQDIVMTAMSCGPERDARDGRFVAFFQNSPTIERQGESRLRLVAGKTELILERPEVRRLAYLPSAAELQGKWKMNSLQHNYPGGGHGGIGLTDIPGHVVFAGDRLSFDACPEFALTYKLSAKGQLAKTGGVAPPNLKACAALDRPRISPQLPHEPEALRILHASPMAEKPAPDQLLLTAGEDALYLVRVP